MSAPPVAEFVVPEPNILSRHTAWELDFRQIDSGPMETLVRLRPSADVTLLDISMSKGVHQRGCSPRNSLTFGLPTAASRLVWNGREVESPYLVDFGSGREFDYVNGTGFNALTVNISRQFAVRLCERMGLPDPDKTSRNAATPVRRISLQQAEMLDRARSFVDRPSRRYGKAEQENLAVLLLMANSISEDFGDRSIFSDRARSVRRAVDYIEDQAGESPLISDICAAARVSWRTLDRGFKEQFGIGPKAYLNRLRLVRARSELLRMRDGASVADVANLWGFWHMGQFARDYFKMFGERPSDTLRRPATNG